MLLGAQCWYSVFQHKTELSFTGVMLGRDATKAEVRQPWPAIAVCVAARTDPFSQSPQMTEGTASNLRCQRQDYKTSTFLRLNNSHSLEGSLWSLPIFTVGIWGRWQGILPRWKLEVMSETEWPSPMAERFDSILTDKKSHSYRILRVLCTTLLKVQRLRNSPGSILGQSGEWRQHPEFWFGKTSTCW